VGKVLGNGHAVIDNENFRGRPVAKWIPLYGEAAKPEIERLRAELVERLGEARARRVADTNRNLVIFPNLVVNDGSSVTIRTFHPFAPDHMEVTAWALGPKGESAQARAIRLDSFLTFYGPGGFATPDDVEALESVQKGMAAWREVPWSVMTRGMAKQGEQLNTDELHLRSSDPLGPPHAGGRMTPSSVTRRRRGFPLSRSGTAGRGSWTSGSRS
jgi:p-cumate 2,3-dioxygenase alpha subunit